MLISSYFNTMLTYSSEFLIKICRRESFNLYLEVNCWVVASNPWSECEVKYDDWKTLKHSSNVQLLYWFRQSLTLFWLIQVNFWLKYAEESYFIYTLKLIAGLFRKINDRNTKSNIMIRKPSNTAAMSSYYDNFSHI